MSTADPVGPEVRHRIAAAAMSLFGDRGYDQTTVDAIAERAGIARRTFFRHFKSKDDVIFPDHPRIVAEVADLLAASSSPPVHAVCDGVRLVFASYVEDPGVAVQRYQLTKSVKALRDRELAGVSAYQRLFSRYLREAWPERQDAVLRADVVAAAVVAAHNQVLREWLRGTLQGDPGAALDHALDWVGGLFEPASGEGAAAGGGAVDPAGAGGSDVVVAVFRARESLDEVVDRISKTL